MYYVLLLGFFDSICIGILKYDVDIEYKLYIVLELFVLLFGELIFDYIKLVYFFLFEGLGELDEFFFIIYNFGIKFI